MPAGRFCLSLGRPRLHTGVISRLRPHPPQPRPLAPSSSSPAALPYLAVILYVDARQLLRSADEINAIWARTFVLLAACCCGRRLVLPVRGADRAAAGHQTASSRRATARVFTTSKRPRRDDARGARRAGLRAEAAGARNPPTLLFVPGWMRPAGFGATARTLRARLYRVGAIDPRSQGASSKPSEGTTRPRARATSSESLIVWASRRWFWWPRRLPCRRRPPTSGSSARTLWPGWCSSTASPGASTTRRRFRGCSPTPTLSRQTAAPRPSASCAGGQKAQGRLTSRMISATLQRRELGPRHLPRLTHRRPRRRAPHRPADDHRRRARPRMVTYSRTEEAHPDSRLACSRREGTPLRRKAARVNSLLDDFRVEGGVSSVSGLTVRGGSEAGLACARRALAGIPLATARGTVRMSNDAAAQRLIDRELTARGRGRRGRSQHDRREGSPKVSPGAL